MVAPGPRSRPAGPELADGPVDPRIADIRPRPPESADPGRGRPCACPMSVSGCLGLPTASISNQPNFDIHVKLRPRPIRRHRRQPATGRQLYAGAVAQR